MGTSAGKSEIMSTVGTGVLDLTVVIVNYNVREFLEQALRSVYRAGEHLSMEVFVVDNNSVDGSSAMVRADFPEAHLIVNEANVGFSRANNQAIRLARGRFVLILNPDTIVQEDTFGTLIRFMNEHPNAGAVGCKILHPDGSFARESRRSFPTPRVAFYRLVGLASLFPRSRTFGRYNMTYLPEDQVSEVDALSGSCMVVRRDALYGSFTGTGSGAGLLDEDFFMYGEDLDWCYRIQQAGWKIFYTPETQIIHYKGESTKRGELRYVRLFYGAMLQFSEKHFESRYSGLFAVLVKMGIVFRAAASLLGKASRRFSWPILDFTVVYACAAAAAVVHSTLLNAEPSPLFFAAVAPSYALGSVAGTAAAGGYGHRRRIRSVWVGVLLGMIFVASASFFVKEIAFSRLVVLSTFPLAASIASLLRIMWSRRRDNPAHGRRAVLVGLR
ncbi:MAG: glycosyltransferase family 2 protein, partial [Rhodothermales bacterium]